MTQIEARGQTTFSQEELIQILEKKIGTEILFSGICKSCCVGFVDIVNSTSITAKLESAQISEYYGIFLNAMSTIVKKFGAVVVKNLGDSILFYFPDTCDCGIDKTAFQNVIECCMAITESHGSINKFMKKRGLPALDYRVSVDYGKVNIAKSSSTSFEDIFGPTVNICSKINEVASPNRSVIGADLYQIVRSIKKYDYRLLGAYGAGLKFDYPTYTLSRAVPKTLFSFLL